MSLDEAYFELAGAGLVACAGGLGLAIPTGAVAAGDAFIGFLSQRGDWTQTHAFVEELKQSAATDGVAHARALVAALERFRLDPDVLAQSLAEPAHPRSVDLATMLIGRARQSGMLATPLSETVAFDLTQRLLGRILAEPAFLVGLHGAFIDYFNSAFAGVAAPSSDGQPGSEPASPVERVRPKVSLVRGDSSPRASAFKSRLPTLTAINSDEKHPIRAGARERLRAILEAQSCPPALVESRLAEMTTWLAALISSLQRLSNEDVSLRRAKADAAHALADGDFERALERLNQGRRLVREARRRLEQRLREDIAALDAEMAAEARAIEHVAEMEMARGNYAAAAAAFVDARDSLPPANRDAELALVMRQASAWLRLGRDFSDVHALRMAREAYEEALSLGDRRQMPDVWHAAQCGIAEAVTAAAERDGSAAALEEAVVRWREAARSANELGLADATAEARLRLGGSLLRLGELDGGRARLQQATDAFREALRPLARDDAPLLWARAQCGLGDALLAMYERETNAGDAWLQEALLAYRQSLTALTREAVPEMWAHAQTGAGQVHLALGADEGPVAHLAESVLAFHESLLVFDRARHPFQWLTARIGLADAYATIGQRQRDPERLEAAAATYRDVLRHLEADTRSLAWATAQLNLGTVLIRLGELRDRQSNWSAALAAIVPALQVFEAEEARDLVEAAQQNLRSLHRVLHSPQLRLVPKTA